MLKNLLQKNSNIDEYQVFVNEINLLENNLNKSVQKLGNDAIYVQKWPWEFGSDYPWWKYFNGTGRK